MKNNKIKIFVDAHCFDTEYQGTQSFLKGLYTALINNYNDIDVYFGAFNKDNILNKFSSAEAANVLQYKFSKPSFRRLFVDIPAILKKNKFHFAHFQNISPIQKINCTSIITLHDVLFNDYKKEFPFAYRVSRNLLFGRSIKKAAIKTTVSTYSAERIHYHYKVPHSQINLIANSVDAGTELYPERKEDARNYIQRKYRITNFLLCVSRIEPRKNQQLLLKKFLDLKLHKQNMCLVFIGKKSINNTHLNKHLQNLDSEERQSIFHFEQVEQHDLNAFYKACKLFVYPSKAEGFGIPPLEAANHKVPVLCSNASAMRDFSFFYPHTFCPYNEQEFENKLLSILQNPPTQNFLDDLSKKIDQQYSWEKSAEIFYELLKANVQI